MQINFDDNYSKKRFILKNQVIISNPFTHYQINPVQIRIVMDIKKNNEEYPQFRKLENGSVL